MDTELAAYAHDTSVKVHASVEASESCSLYSGDTIRWT